MLSRIQLSAAGLLLLGSNAVQAQTLALAELPASCRYTSNVQQPLTGLVQIPAATPVFSDIGDAQSEIANIGVQCDGPVSQPVSFSFSESGSVSWLGPGRDVLATSVPGIGVRLLAEGQSEAGQCAANGPLGAGKSASCTLSPGAEGVTNLSLRLKAQLVKIGNNTPLNSQQAMRLADGGALMLVSRGASEQSLDLLNGGLLSPTIATAASCTLVTEQNPSITFGQVYRPKSGSEEITLGQPQATAIEVSCLPLRDNADNNYSVAVSFTAGELKPGDDKALATDIDDMAIRFASTADGRSWLKFGEKQVMPLNEATGGDKSHFAQTFFWFLRYLPAGSHHQTGNFSAVATYTVTVQ